MGTRTTTSSGSSPSASMMQPGASPSCCEGLWRGGGVGGQARTAEVHIDDGIVFADGREFTRQLSRRVREDLQKLGLLISEDKCSWGARRELEWVGFKWNTEVFKLILTEDKIDRVKKAVGEMLVKKGKLVTIKEVASVCGLWTSLRLALGDIARLRTRSGMSGNSRSQLFPDTL